MTAIMFQEALEKEVNEALEDLRLKSPVGEDGEKAIQVFKQHLPNKKKSKERFPDTSLFPNVIIRVQEGEQQEQEASIGVRAIFVACVYDPDDENQGYQDVMTIIEKLYQHFSKRPLISSKYTLKYPIRWDYQDDDTEPYFFCSLDTTWDLPTPQNEQVEALV